MLIGLWGIVLVGLLSLGRVVLSDLRLGADSLRRLVRISLM